ncbi:MAG: vitamin B12 dependent-methionine synthase activation domain-containing protein [Bacteroidales bacterium]
MRENFRYTISFSELQPDVDMLRFMLDPSDTGDGGLVSDMIKHGLETAESLCDIRAEIEVYDEVDFSSPGKINIGGLSFNTGKIVAGQLKKSESVAVFSATAGKGVGEKARQLISEKDFLEGYILDMIGSQVADGAADLLQERLRVHCLGKGLRITNRYSPGYCGWDVSEQHKLFSLLPSDFCHITLNEAALMDPVKSVSGIIGIGAEVRFNEYTCNLCDQDNCVYRNIKIRKG